MGTVETGAGGPRCPHSEGSHHPVPSQEMLEIMKSIYDMMGRCTHPTLRDSAPAEHVELFFQVRAIPLVPSQQPRKPLPGVSRAGAVPTHWGQGCPRQAPLVPLQKMDRNGDGVVTFEEFLETCQKVSSSKAGGFSVIAILLLLTARPPSLRHNLIPHPVPKQCVGGGEGWE